ncbi:MAG: SDR family oxidoreductase [Chloroflexi bacterium]|nr:SDR family oxidoreductase [Chloroflexota bacterium]MDA1147277.1 SDR family oxidoreductase [Chloroflexota bacterium]
MDLGLTGKVAIVTGGSDGIGKAAARALAREGARVAICARRPDVLEAAAAELRAETGGEVIGIVCDMTKQAEVKALVADVVGRWSQLDILVNNAGTSSAMPVESLDEEALSYDLQLKVYGAVYASQAAIPHMKALGSGRIINITTGGGKAPGASSLPTSLSRAAGIALTKAMSRDLAPANILVNTVCIGLIKAGQHERRVEAMQDTNPALTLDDHYENMSGRVPLGRVGEAQEAGDVICFLASERASYVTGASINVDGGVAPVV